MVCCRHGIVEISVTWSSNLQFCPKEGEMLFFSHAAAATHLHKFSRFCVSTISISTYCKSSGVVQSSLMCARNDMH